MKKIGLTGIMGSGKSSVIKILENHKIRVIDCDVVNRQLQQKGNVGYLALLKLFGDVILNEQLEIDAKKMSDVIFTNATRRKQAEDLLHPLIKKNIMEKIKQHENEDLIVVEVPLLFEIHWEDFFDEVWVVASDEKILLERLQKYRHIALEEAKRRLCLQMPIHEKIAKADVVIWNNSDLNSLEKQVIHLIAER